MCAVFSNNQNRRKDHLRDQLSHYGKNCDVWIAVAFFRDYMLIEELVNRKSDVKLIIRLGYPTDPFALKKLLDRPHISIRFYTSRKFHPKLYILGDEIAFVGSSNLTDGGIFGNQELNVSIDAEHPDFDDLKTIFRDYWEHAAVLTKDRLAEYNEIFKTLDERMKEINTEEDVFIRSSFGGEVVFPSVTFLDVKRLPKHFEFEESILKRYQDFLIAFEQLKEIYKSYDQRKVSENVLPLRIEIHRFLSWVRKNKAIGNAYMDAPIRVGDKLKDFLIYNLQEYFSEDLSVAFESVINDYKYLKEHFSSDETIDALTEEQLMDGLMKITAFYEHVRHTPNWILKDQFIELNGAIKIKNTLKYLLFNIEHNRASRIVNCILNPEYRLHRFRESSIFETYGWINMEEIPICNERAFKSMQWLGFGGFK